MSSLDGWIVGDPKPSEGGGWHVEIIRSEDKRVMSTVPLTPENLPPRKKGGKIAWQLPKDRSVTPRLGLSEKERVVQLFREQRKQQKRHRARQDAVAPRVQRAVRRFLWRRRLAAWVRMSRQPRRYTREELLSLRPALASAPPIGLPSFAVPSVHGDSSASWRSSGPPSHHQTLGPSLGGEAAAASNGMDPAVAQLFGHAEPQLFLPSGILDQNTPPRESHVPPPPPPGLELSGSSLQDTVHLVAPSAPHGSVGASKALDLQVEKEQWKVQWKADILAKLDGLAEAAWLQYSRGERQEPPAGLQLQSAAPAPSSESLFFL